MYLETLEFFTLAPFFFFSGSSLSFRVWQYHTEQTYKENSVSAGCCFDIPNNDCRTCIA